jgi:putative SOS response-associated peptidase YedK
MCGRFALGVPRKAVEEHFQAEVVEDFGPCYNIPPGEDILAVIERGGRRAGKLRWGLVPFWAEEEKIGYKMINARAEGLFGKPAFRQAARKRRCIAPAQAFYEWGKTAEGKQPYALGAAGQEVFGMAGIWERWERPDGGELYSCAIVTCAANELAGRVHHRMPVILAPEDYAPWLDPETRSGEEVEHLLRPYPPEKMWMHAVSRRVSSPANDDPSVLEPVGA